MLSDNVRSAVSLMMKIGCYLKMYPYDWDAKKSRLIKTAGVKNIGFYVHTIIRILAFTYVTVRFLQTLKVDMPPRIRVQNFVWIIAMLLGIACNVQFITRREAIMFFVNSLFEAQDQERENAKDNTVTKDSKVTVTDWASVILLVSSVLMYTNTPAHAIVLVVGPCSPMYLSSVVHTCASAIDVPISILEALPYVLYENYIVGAIVFVWTFNWSMIFMGFLWIKNILGKTNAENKGRVTGEIDPMEYRRCQIWTLLLNDAFELYLQWFPSVLFTMTGMMLFAAIRYTDLNFFLYSVYPSCAIRCWFEASTALAAAGMTNQESVEFLRNLRRQIDSTTTQENERDYMTAFQKSCPHLQIKAGSLYTFENSIVLVSLDNCTQLTFNMLVTYK